MLRLVDQPDTSGARILVRVEQDGRLLTWEEAIAGWNESPEFTRLFCRALADAPYRAFRWETPALTRDKLHQPFEWVLIDAPELARRADSSAFDDHLRTAHPTASVVTFENLGGDALLLVPLATQTTGIDNFAHLADFLRGAPVEQQQELWRRVAETLMRRVGTQPVWLNTDGDGVPWLHIRLDSQPKYYHHMPYAR